METFGNHGNVQMTLAPRPTTTQLHPATLVVALAFGLLLTACGGAQFERTTGSKKYRPLPKGTPIKVVDDASTLPGPTEEIGTMTTTTKGKEAKVEEASEDFKTTASKYGCDAVVGLKSTQREIKKQRTVTKIGAGGVRTKEKVEEISYEHDWSAKCIRTAEAPKEVPRTRRGRRGTATASTTTTTTTTTKPATTTAGTKPASTTTASSSGGASTGSTVAGGSSGGTTTTTPATTGGTTAAGAGSHVAPPRPPSADAQLASEVARSFLAFSNYIASGNVNMLCKMLDTERIYFDIRTKNPKLEIKVDLGPEAACASLRTGDLGSYLRDFGPAEVHTEIRTLVPSLFRIHGGAYLKLDAAQEAAYSQKLSAQRTGRKQLACNMYTVLPAGNLFKVSVNCEGVNSYRLLLRRDKPDDFKLMAMTHIR